VSRRARNRRGPSDPWQATPVDELQDQLLPRWFVITALVTIPVAIGVLVAAFFVFGPERVPVAERRPPPEVGLTNAVGNFAVGDREPQRLDDLCPVLSGVRVAGSPADRRVLRRGIEELCSTPLAESTSQDLAAFVEAGGVVRFAQFRDTGVASTAQLQRDPPRILVNAKYSRTEPLWVAPLVAHDAALWSADPASARAALEARRVEARVCQDVLAGQRLSRDCRDARALLDLADPLAALRRAGYR
jgi:hypothetical protein